MTWAAPVSHYIDVLIKSLRSASESGSCLTIDFLTASLQHLTKAGYLAVGLAAALPLAFLPLILQPAAEQGKPWGQRFWVKSQVQTAAVSSTSCISSDCDRAVTSVA